MPFLFVYWNKKVEGMISRLELPTFLQYIDNNKNRRNIKQLPIRDGL